MDQKQTFNLSPGFFGDYISNFVNIVFAVILVYVIIMIINFFRDKYIHQESIAKQEDILGLLTVLNKLFFISGFGFILANVFQFTLNQISNHNPNIPAFMAKGQWDYFTFGIILIFMGIGFQAGKKVMKKEAISKNLSNTK